MSNITLGPIIGLVTKTTARIMIEISQFKSVTCILKSEKRIIEKIEDVNGDIPYIFKFDNLEPNTKYEVSFRDMESISSSFTTFYDNQDINFGFVSCNKIRITKNLPKNQDLWKYVKDIDILCHIGDQVYIDHDLYSENKDNAYTDAIRLLESQNKMTWECQKYNIINRFKKEYIETWTHPTTAHVMANTPNIMMFDDHEIVNSWGDEESHYTEGTMEHFIGECAREVIDLYQVQLHHDIEKPEPHYYYSQDFDDTKLVFLDIRGCKTFYRDDSNMYLGKNQWHWLEKTIKEAKCKHLILISPIPFIFLSTFITETSSNKFGDLKGCWNFGEYKKELEILLHTLIEWKKDTNKISLVSGDIHMGGFTSITKDDVNLFDQLITSPIANIPPTDVQMVALDMMKSHGDTFKTLDIEYKHQDWIKYRNYGIVNSRGLELRFIDDNNRLASITNYLEQEKGGWFCC